MLRLLCLAISLLVLAGCASYEPQLKVGQKGATGRSLEDISRDRSRNLDKLAEVFDNIKNAESAKAAVPKVKELYEVWKDLVLEEKAAKKAATPEEESRIQQKYSAALRGGEDNVRQKIEGLSIDVRIAPIPPELTKALDDGKAAVAEATDATVASGPLEIVPSQPVGSAWMMWILSVFVLAACAGFLYRDGIWSNAIRLVNVVFAGLLTMNFHEPLAKFITDYSEDIHTFTPFMDFLAFWLCFVGFAAIMMVITDKVSRVRVRFMQVAERVGAAVLTLCIGWVMVGIVLTSLHMAPLGEYPFLGCFQPQASMFLGMLAPDREWLGFTKYESEGPLCQAVSSNDLKKVAFSDVGENNFIDKHHMRRIEVERYVRGNASHDIRVNKQFVGGAPPPRAAP